MCFVETVHSERNSNDQAMILSRDLFGEWLSDPLERLSDLQLNYVVYIPGDSSRDLFIPYLEVTIHHLKGHVFTPKRSL